MERKRFRLAIFMIINVVLFSQIYLAYLLWHTSEPHEWLLGEWLINYQGGFVRRGLLGETLLQLSRLLSINVVHLTIIAQIIVFTIFLYSTYFLIKESPLSPATVVLIFSPAFILFVVWSWLHVGVRKEVFLYITLVFICLCLQKSIPKGFSFPVLIGISAVALVLCHEMLVAYLPYLIMPVILYERGFGQITRRTLLALLPGILVALLLVTRPTISEATWNIICNSIQPIPPRDCLSNGEYLGAITFLTKDTSFGIRFTRSFTTLETTTVYIVTGLLSFIPVVHTISFYKLWENLSKKAILLIGSCFSIIIILMIPLFIVAADYGRFISIHITCISIIILWFLRRSPTITHIENDQTPIIWGGVVLFLTNWKLPMWLLFATFQNAFPLISQLLVQH